MLLPILAGQQGNVPVETTLSGTPRKRPIRRKPPAVTPYWQMFAVDAAGHLTDEEFILLSSIDID